MYVSTMKSVNYPLALPLDFLDEFKQAAKEAINGSTHSLNAWSMAGTGASRRNISGITAIRHQLRRDDGRVKRGQSAGRCRQPHFVT